MTLLDHLRQKQALWCVVCEWGVTVLLILAIVWRGGKSLDMTWILTGVACIGACIAHMHKADKEDVIPLRLWGATMGFVVLTGISLLFSETKNYGFDEVLRMGALALMFFWMIRNIQRSKEVSMLKLRLLRVLGLTTVGACLLGIVVYVFQPVNRFVGTFFDYRFQTDYWPNAWADFLLLAWPLVLFLALKDFTFDAKKTGSRIEFLIRSLVVGFVIGCLFLSYSRGAILVFFVQLLLWAALVYKKTRPEFPIRRVVPVGFMVTVVALVTFLTVNTLRSQVYEVQDVAQKVTFSASEGTSSISEREQFWRQSLVLATKKPLLGWGPYSFRFIQPELQRHVLATSDHPHNVVLKLLVERGVIVALLFVFIVGSVVYASVSHLLSEEVKEDSLVFSLHMFVLLSVAGVLLHNMIDFNMQFVGIALPFWLVLGMLFTFSPTSGYRMVPRNVARVSELVLATALLVMAFYEGGYLVVTSLGRHAEAQHDAPAALRWYARAGGEIFSRDLQLSRAKLYFEDSNYDEAQEAIDTYMRGNSHDYRAWKRMGDIALLQGRKQEALDAYKTAFAKGKYNDLGILRGILETYQAMDDLQSIDVMRAEIDPLLIEFSDAIATNEHFIALSPNVEEFVSVCNTLSRLFPDNAPAYQVMAAKADHHAQLERSRIESRSPGFLW